MERRTIHIGNQKLQSQYTEVRETPASIDGKSFYQITGYDQMPPFLISLVSNSNHWMYLSSRGGLSCGRRNPDQALFPYYTDDKIHDASDNSGPLTRILVDRGDGIRLWRPFSDGCPGVYDLERRLYKSVYGNQIIFAKRDGSGHKIYGIMKNGNYQRMLFSFPGSQTYPRWAVKYN